MLADYTKGTTLSAATVLPATTAAGLWYANMANSWVVWGLLAVSAVGLIVSAASISRYVVNRRRNA